MTDSPVTKTAEQIVAEINTALTAEYPGVVAEYHAMRDAALSARRYLLASGAPSESADSADDVRQAVRKWGERFIPGDSWDTEDMRDLNAALNCVVEATPNGHDRRRAADVGSPAPAQADEAKLRESLREVLAGQEAMHCTRVWEAWQVGTMTADDFSLIADDDEAFEEIVQAALKGLRGGAQ